MTDQTQTPYKVGKWMLERIEAKRVRMYELTGVQPTVLRLSRATLDALCAEAIVRGLVMSTRAADSNIFFCNMAVKVDATVQYGFVRLTHEEVLDEG